MPTGYTAPIYEGKDITFSEFAWGCARAFGALVTMRDDARDAPIPGELEPSTSYYETRLAESRNRLAEAQMWSDGDAAREANRDHDAAVERAEESRAKNTELRGRYWMMLAQVELWEPPSGDHEGLKNFMVKQLQQSIDFDTGHDGYPVPLLLSGPEYREQEIEKAERDIEYAETHIEEEVERTRTRNLWLAQLRESLDGVLA